MNVNFTIPNLRLPCLHKGDLCLAPLTNFDGNPFILCSLPHLTEKEAWLLEAHAKEVEKSDGTLAILLKRTFPSSERWVRHLHEFGFPIFVDPMKRLSRSLRLLHTLPLQRCESLIFDHRRSLKFRVFHNFSLRGLSTMLSIARTDRVSLTQLSSSPVQLDGKHRVKSGFSQYLLGQPEHNKPRPQSVPLKNSEICA
ncbi:MAG: hypothetical protein AB7T38_14855 [Nitrospirales bacterium]